MGLSASQAKFLSVTSRKIDLEQRMQEICRRRLGLAGKMDEIADDYNRAISDRRLYVQTVNSTSGEGTTGIYHRINVQDLLDNDLYVLGDAGLMGATISNVASTTSYWNTTGSGDDAPASASGSPTATDPTGHSVGEVVNVDATHQRRYTGVTKTITTPYNPGNPGGTSTITIDDLKSSDLTTGVAVPSGTDAALTTAVANNAGLEWASHPTYTLQADGSFVQSTITSVAINDQAGFDALMAVWETNAGSNSNYIFMTDVDASSRTGTSNLMDNFSGILDGNGKSISGFNLTTVNGTTGTGLIGNLSGTVKNLELDNAVFDIDAGATNVKYVGGIAGKISSTAVIHNVDMTNLQMDVKSTSSSSYPVSYVTGVAGYATSGAIIDRLNLSGDINVENPNYMVDNIAGVVGNSVSSTISKSNIGININITGATDCIGIVDACGVATKFDNCAITGSLIVQNDNLSTDATNGGLYLSGSHPDLGINSGGGGTANITNSYRTYNAGDSVSQYLTDYDGPTNDGFYDSTFTKYWDGTVSGAVSDSTDDPASTLDWDTDIWNVTGTAPPTLNTNAQRTATVTIPYVAPTPEQATFTWHYDIEELTPDTTYDVGYASDGTLSDDELEEGLRNGTLYLAKHADNQTQEKINLNFGTFSVDYEQKDWRTQSVVHDDLYEANDYDARIEYENKVEEVNAQDKKLELEQQQVETEYNAITTERDTIKRLIATNSEKSFKLFG